LTSQPERPYLRILFAASAVILTAATILYLAFQDRELTFDEAGLQNPPYMLLNYARMTYPIHGHFDDMVVHPPTHYAAIALFQWLGLSLFHAAAAEDVLFFVLAALLLVTARMPYAGKFGLLFGTYLAVVIWTSTQTMRPDVTLALAWIAGLIGLESGRLNDWDPKRLFIGSGLLAYAAALHYTGGFCWLGILVYTVWAWRSLERNAALRRIAMMAGGLALVGIPYLLMFLVPYHHQILEMVSQTQGEGGIGTALHHHVDAYRQWANLSAGRFAMQPLVQTLLTPLWWSRIPAAFIGPVVLAAFRSTRGLAVAALPQLLFMALGARHKDWRFSGYFAPEMIIYFAAILSSLLAALFYLTRKISARSGSLALTLAGLGMLAGFSLHDKPTISGNRVRFSRDLNDLELSRAAGREIAGPDAFIGSTSLGVWYTGGGTHFYLVSPEIQYGPSLIARPREFAARFDGLVIDQLESWVTWNKERANLTSLYLAGDLRLKGFWLGDKRASAENDLSWMMYAAADKPVRGFAYDSGHVYRFDQAAEGNSVFFCAVCTSAELRNHGQFRSFGTLYFPSATNDDPRAGGDSTPLIRMLLVSKEQFQRDVVPAAAHCKVRDQIAGNVTEVDPAVLLAQSRASDHTIRFYRSFATALAGTHRLNSANTDRIAGIVSLEGLQATGPDPRVTRNAGAVDVLTPVKRWWDAAAVTINHAQPLERAFVYVRGKVIQGVIGISIRASDPNTILGTEAIWGATDAVNELYLPIASFDEARRVVIRNQRAEGPSEALIEDIAVVTEKIPAPAAAPPGSLR